MNLMLPTGRQEMVHALVQGHLQSNELAVATFRTLVSESAQQKGNALVILLHGASSVGKTSTAGLTIYEIVCQVSWLKRFAESVALANGKLVFPINTMNEDFELEFRLAQVFDLIPICGGAETFLTPRTRAFPEHDGVRSALFEILDQYKGVVFLESSKLDKVDEAFRSRIHFSLYFPPLSQDQTLGIWSTNIDKVVENGVAAVDKADILKFALNELRASNGVGGRSSPPSRALSPLRGITRGKMMQESIKRVVEDSVRPLPKLERKYFDMVLSSDQALPR
ncbi:hypothetical protein MMC13_006001 [Lambiella insularis]|nr:hypothetical protein [Lambiella insularis]